MPAGQRSSASISNGPFTGSVQTASDLGQGAQVVAAPVTPSGKTPAGGFTLK
jgi:hypothetical protein